MNAMSRPPVAKQLSDTIVGHALALWVDERSVSKSADPDTTLGMLEHSGLLNVIISDVGVTVEGFGAFGEGPGARAALEAWRGAMLGSGNE